MPGYEPAGPGLDPGQSVCISPSCSLSIFWMVNRMITWQNLGKVNCRTMVVTPAMCPGIMGSYQPQAQQETEMSAGPSAGLAHAPT